MEFDHDEHSMRSLLSHPLLSLHRSQPNNLSSLCFSRFNTLNDETSKTQRSASQYTRKKALSPQCQNLMQTTSEFVLSPPVSVDNGALPLIVGECVLVRIPVSLNIGQNLDASTVAGSGVPPTSNARSPQHFAFIRSLSGYGDGYMAEVYPVVSFTLQGGAEAGYNNLDTNSQRTLIDLIPLPPLSHCAPTPQLFGNPLILGNWQTLRDSWLSVILMRFIIPRSRPVSVVPFFYICHCVVILNFCTQFKRFTPFLIMSGLDLYRIDQYRDAVLANLAVPDANDDQEQAQPHPRTGDNSAGAGQESEQAGSGGGPRRAFGNLFCFGNRTDSEGMEGDALSTLPSTDKLPILSLEGVDEDAQDANATMKDELILLAHGNKLWTRELEKFIEAENREMREMQQHRAVMLENWRQHRSW